MGASATRSPGPVGINLFQTNRLTLPYIWSKQEKSRRVPRVITRGTSCGRFVSDKLKAFPLFVSLCGSKTEEDAAEGLPVEIQEGQPEY